MGNRSYSKPKICYTAAGILIHQAKVLLIKHKKLNIWLSPGGHIEPGELPHQAAEREFLEEAGISVTAINPRGHQPPSSQQQPHPLTTNLHWVSRENYEKRQASGEKHLQEPVSLWPKGCEQHFGFLFLLEPQSESVAETINADEATDIGWFSLEEALQLSDIKKNILDEISYAFAVHDLA